MQVVYSGHWAKCLEVNKNRIMSEKPRTIKFLGFFYWFIVRNTADRFKQWWLFNFVFSSKKPLYLLYLWNIIDNQKLLFILTKLLVWIIIVSAYLATDFGNSSSTYNYFIVSILALTNSVLVFKEHQFNVRYFYLTFNFPIPKCRFFFRV